jgi:hypothetical protein
VYQNCVAQEARQDQQGDDIEFARRSIHGERTQPPKQGYVPSEALAVALARAVLNPLYGEEAMAKEEPFNARFAQGIWTVIGTSMVRGSEASQSYNYNRVMVKSSSLATRY